MKKYYISFFDIYMYEQIYERNLRDLIEDGILEVDDDGNVFEWIDDDREVDVC